MSTGPRAINRRTGATDPVSVSSLDYLGSSLPNYLSRTPAEVVSSWSSSYKRAVQFQLERGLPRQDSQSSQDIEGPDFLTPPQQTDYREYEEPEPTEETPLIGSVTKSTYAQSCFNAVNVLMGIGLLSLPFSFKITGWIVGLSLMLLFAFQTRHTAILLQKCLDHPEQLSNTYGDVGEAAFGKQGRHFISILFFLELFAASVALVILAADSIVALVPGLDIITVKIAVVALVLPMTYSRSLSFVAYGSFLGVLALVNLLVIVFFDGLTTQTTPGSIIHPAYTSLYPDDWFNVPFAVGLIVSGFCGHSVFPNIYRDMDSPQRYRSLVNVSFTWTLLIYILLASAGYVMFGADIKEEITQNFPLVPSFNPILTQMTIVLVALNPITKYPLAMTPINLQLESMFLFLGSPTTARFIGCTCGSLGVLVISILFPGFQNIMALLGSFFSIVVSITFPEICYLVLFGRDLTFLQKLFEVMMLVISSLLAITGTLWAFIGLRNS
ncbi:transmembrane amino acid transporter protein-domain-containing protein [Gorgonomyces haynaldii]|nr:transmembrane amino acid transporter protein-domain-containing protein [Gorgonomyces haynaldii]